MPVNADPRGEFPAVIIGSFMKRSVDVYIHWQLQVKHEVRVDDLGIAVGSAGGQKQGKLL